MKILPIPLLVFAAAAIFTNSAFAEPGKQTKKHMGAEVEGQQLEYWLYLPDGTDKAEEKSKPFVLFLHGAGERGDDLERVKVHGPPKLVGTGSPIDDAIVVSPQCPVDSWWKAKVLKALVDEVVESNPAIDPSRLYVTGLSMGGYGSWSMISEYPELFAAAVPICGGGDIGRLGRGRGRPSTFSMEKLLKSKDLPIWAFHGDADRAVPVEESKVLVEALKEAGSESVKLTIYEGVGHDSWTQTYANPEMWKWLLSKSKE